MTLLSAGSPPASAAGPLSHSRQWRPEVVQAVPPPGAVDLGPGYLDPALLPVDLLKNAYGQALEEFGSAALGYGADPGARLLRECVAARATAADGRWCDPDQVLITAGTSQALQLVSTAMAVPGQVVLTDRTSYDFGRRIITDQGLRLRAVDGDEGGMSPRALHDALSAVRAAGGTPAFAYVNPTHHNPTGTTLDLARREELLAVAARHDLLVVEDDAYAELTLADTAPPSSLAALARHAGVVRLGTFAKTLAPGLRLGWLQAHHSVADRLVRRGLFVSGGCLNHLTSLAVAVLLRDGHYDRHLRWLRRELKTRRDALVAALRANPACRAEFDRPAGGFFLWLRFPAGRSEAELVSTAADAGVTVAAGSRFGEVTRPSIRLAYSFNPPERLATAASLLAGAWTTTGNPS
ncbi:aminotransferase class I/II-fold pyridoxal phosphate-dependent enzyme [Amycolatopsis sp. RTGN1]|uniref:aminotransferase class I/II-fold pyridoxal phosphate-dependent enzyme n=1 Tax=Amycolatopsis ponsaeliensis TaxID=2992142 RepID=UPI0025511507|nr:aminotransferase class I/II-fold pyridoxal phosphate-dependent enzyme [Amycolatopsis sp. RTGN1]